MSVTTKDVVWDSTKNLLSGSASGVALVLAGHSFDTVKVRLQTSQGRFKGPIHCLLVTLKEEGVRGLYKGATPPLITTGFINSIMFTLMAACKQNITKYHWLENPNDPSQPSIKQVMLCGTTTGLLLAFIVTPIECVKAKLQVQYAGHQPEYSGPISCIRKTYKVGGIRALYAGFVSTLIHRGSNWSYFGGYEVAKRYFSKNEKVPKSVGNLLAGAFAGVCFWLSCYPVDVVKNRMQTQSLQNPKYHSFRHCISSIWRQEGLKAFFRGFTPAILRGLPANAAAFFAYETVYNLLPERL